MNATCAYCGRRFEILTGHYNRAKKSGLEVYCSRRHSGLGRRLNKSKKEIKEEKWWYDQFNRLFLADEIKRKKHEWFKRDYEANPEKYKNIREAKQESHNEYCRRPEYKAYKHEYDSKRHHQSHYGDFWEASMILMQLEKEIDIRLAKEQNEIFNKSQKRKRQWQKVQPKPQLNSLLQI